VSEQATEGRQLCCARASSICESERARLEHGVEELRVGVEGQGVCAPSSLLLQRAQPSRKRLHDEEDRSALLVRQELGAAMRVAHQQAPEPRAPRH